MNTLLLIEEADSNILNKYPLDGDGEIYSIYCNGDRVGIVEYEIHSGRMNMLSLYIDDRYQRRGIGGNVIKLIQDKHGLDIEGLSVTDSVGFWLSIGANFYGEDEDIDKYEEVYECIPFIIERR